MKRLILFIFCCAFFLTGSISAVQETLSFRDVPRVLERFFHFHIENKELSPLLVRRALKLYIEQFDFEKAYLLEKEIEPYASMSQEKAEQVLLRVQNRDYSDFIQLNRLLQESVVRAQRLRQKVAQQFFDLSQDWNGAFNASGIFMRYAQTEEELLRRQQGRMMRFYQFHHARANLNSRERQIKVFNLFEKKVQHFENFYLFLSHDGKVLPRERIEHLLCLRMLKAFAKSLDTHTAFFSPEEAYEMRLSLEKQFDGVGVVLSEGIEGVVIAELIEGGPAEQSGQIQVNDMLIEIDGVSVTQASFDEVLSLLKQKDRSKIVLGLKRFDPVAKKEKIFRVSLAKQPIAMKNERIKVSHEVVENGIIGKISLRSFYDSGDGVSSEKDIREAIKTLRQKGELKGLILDLRENSGGFLGQAVRVAGLFVSNGVIAISKYGKGDIHYLRNISGKSYFNGPLIILTSKMSASASEIVAQTLQDYGVALVVGDERTFGKGSIQYQTITDASADVFFKVTVGRYYTASGRSTQIEGVRADIVVPTPYAPYKIGEQYLEYPLPADHVAPAFLDPLSDLDEKTRFIFQKKYLPNLQPVVSFWKNILPVLKQRSAERVSSNIQFQNFLGKIEKIRLRQTNLPINAIDEPFEATSEDLQMKEASFILKDMIQLRASAGPLEEENLQTGS